MPLPAPRSPWPPPALDPALKQFRVWDAWWSGDPEQLSEVYGGSYGGGPSARPSQSLGGVVGFLSRMWWGRPTPTSETEEKLHVPLAGDLCRASADMLFSEPLKATADDDATSARLEVLLDDSGQAKLSESAEIVAALGGGYLRPVYDKTVSDRAWLDTVAPDAAIPTWRWGSLAEVTFWRELHCEDGQVWRHFEHHEPGWIVHALYQGTDDDIGRPVPLEDRPETAGYASQVNEAGAIETGYPRLDVTYIPHALPNRRWRAQPMLAPMGRSVLDGCEPLLDALDMTYSALMRDVDLSRGRVIVPGTWLDDQGPGRGASFDPNRKYFAPVPSALKMDEPKVVQFEVRVAQFEAVATDIVHHVLRHAGFAGQTLGESGDVAVTATEVNARERRSFVTRGRQIGYWRPGLAERALPALLAIDAHAFGRTYDPSIEVHVEFADSVQEDLLTIANTIEVLDRSGAISTRTKVGMARPEWSDAQVDAEVALIEQGRAAGMPAPFDYGSGPTETADQRAALGQDGGTP